MNKLLVIGKIQKTDYELFKTISDRDRIFDFVEIATFNDVFFDFNSQDFEVVIKGKSLREFNVIYIRSIFSIDEEVIDLIVRYAKMRNIRIVDRVRSVQASRLSSKIIAYYKLKEVGLPIIESYFVNLEQSKTLANKGNLLFPFILKASDEARGDNVFLIKNDTDIDNAFNESKKNRLISQPFIENNGDLRVIVVGDKVLGAIRRYNPDDYRNNVSVGGEVEVVEVTDEIKKISKEGAKALDIEIAGVDLIFNKKTNRWEIMEINIGPQFNGFKKATRIDIEKEVLDYIRNS